MSIYKYFSNLMASTWKSTGIRKPNHSSPKRKDRKVSNQNQNMKNSTNIFCRKRHHHWLWELIRVHANLNLDNTRSWRRIMLRDYIGWRRGDSMTQLARINRHRQTKRNNWHQLESNRHLRRRGQQRYWEGRQNLRRGWAQKKREIVVWKWGKHYRKPNKLHRIALENNTKSKRCPFLWKFGTHTSKTT